MNFKKLNLLTFISLTLSCTFIEGKQEFTAKAPLITDTISQPKQDTLSFLTKSDSTEIESYEQTLNYYFLERFKHLA